MEKAINSVTSLIGDPVRSKILWALLDGRAFTASELSVFTDTSAQNISMHLAKLVKGELLTVERQGRHKYYRFARHEVASAIEAIASLIPNNTYKDIINKSEVSAIKYCRTCYDHLAGKVSVMITEALINQGMITYNPLSFEVTRKGTNFFMKLSIDPESLKKAKRSFAKPCLDWSERKHHISGALGAAFLESMLSMNWIRKTKNSRIVLFSEKGRRKLFEMLNISV